MVAMATPSIVSPGEGRLGGSGITPPPKKAAKKPVKKALDFTPDLTPKAKPDPILSKHGVYDTPDVVAQKVKAIKQAHQAHFGTPATAGHVYDVVKANIPIEDVSKLYDAIPRSKRDARLKSIPVMPSPDTQDVAAGIDLGAGFDENQKILDEVKYETLNGNWDGWLADNKDVLKTADPKLRQKIALAKNQADIARANGSMEVAATKRGGIIPATPSNIATVQKAGLDPLVVFGPAFTAFNQFLTGVALGIPYLGIAEGKAIKKSIEQRSADPFVKTQKDLAVGAAKGFKEDFTNPKENAGYLILDLFGLASLGAGAAARAGAVGAAARAGEGGVVRAALSKPAAGTRAVKVGDLEVDLLNSENPFARKIEEGITNRANKKRLEDKNYIPDEYKPGTPDPTPGSEALAAPTKFWQRFVSQETRAKGKLASDRRVETTIREMTRQDLEKVTGWADRYSFTSQRLPSKIKRKLSRGEQVALMIESIDDPGDFAARAAVVKDFHERQIQLGLGDPAAHAQKIRDVDFALRAVRNPSPKLQQALDLTRKAVGEMEVLKEQYGLTGDVARRRVASQAKVLRGDPLTSDSALSEIWRLKQNLREGRGDVAAITTRIDELQGKLSGNNKLPGENELSVNPYKRYIPVFVHNDGRVIVGNPGERHADMSSAVRATVVSDSFSSSHSPKEGWLQGEAVISNGKIDRVNWTEGKEFGREIKGDLPSRLGPTVMKAVEDKFVSRGLPVDMKKASRELDALEAARRRERDPVKQNELDAKIEMRRNDLIRSQDILDSVDQLRDASFYFPLQLDTKVKRSPKNLFRGTRQGEAGVPWRNPEDAIPGIKYAFNGDSLQLGNYRVDTTRLVGEQLGKTVRGVALVNEYKSLLKASSPTRRSQWDVPIRTPGNKKIPDRLREIMNEDHGPNITSTEAEGMSKVDWDKTVKELYNASWNDRKKRWEIDTLAEDGEFRWVDSRLLGADSSLAPAPTALQQAGRALNTPFRFATLYARPAYIANLAGSAGMALWTQGVLTGPNFVRALAYKPAVKDTLRELVGAGKSNSYIPSTGMATRAERGAAHAWNVVTDRDLRVSAMIHFLRKQGVRGNDATDALLKAYKAGDEKAIKTVNEATLRAKKSMVEFDNLSWFEKEYLRQFIFIYPWMKGSAMWNLRAIKERPAVSAVVAQWGDDAQDAIEEQGGAFLKDWLKKTGFTPLFWNDNGNPVAVNTNGINTLASLTQMFSHANDADAYRQFAGPLADVLLGTFTGRDQYGNQYKSTGLLGNAYSALLENTLALPQLRAYKSAKKYGEQSALPGIDIADRETLINRRNAALKQVALAPGWSVNIAGLFNIPGQLLVGGAFNPREVNKMAVLGRQWKLLPEEEKRKIHKDLILTALGMQAEAMKVPVDPDVKRSVERYFDMQGFVDQARKDAGGDLTPLGEAKASFDWLVQNGLASKEDAASDLAYIKKNLPNINKNGPEAIQKYLDPQGKMRQWDENITALAKASDPNTLDVYVNRLRSDGGGVFDSPKGMKVDDLRDYGRQVSEYSRKASDLRKVATDKNLPQAERDKADRQLKELEDSYDDGITVKGKRLPSPVRADWASKDDEERSAALASVATQGWSSLSSLEKELLGRKPGKRINTAWGQYEGLVENYGNTHPSTPQYVKDYYAKYVGKQFDGFYNDYLFSKEKLATRLSYLKPIQNSQYRAKWDEILKVAKQKIASVKNGYPSGQMNNYWKNTVVPYLTEWIQQDPGFDAEVKKYGYNVLNSLLEG